MSLNSSLMSSNKQDGEMNNSLSKSAAYNEFFKRTVKLKQAQREYEKEETQKREVTFEKVIRLLNDKYFGDQYERQVVAIWKLAENRMNGFYLDDNEHLLEIVDHCVKKIADMYMDPSCGKIVDEFLHVLFKIVEIAFSPQLLRKSTDELMKKESLSIMLDVICKIFRIPFTKAIHLKIYAAKCINNMLAMEKNRIIVKTVVEESELTKELLHELMTLAKMISPSHELVYVSLSLVFNISQYSSCCESLSRGGGLDNIIRLLRFTDVSETDTIACSIDILWNVLQRYPDSREIIGDAQSITVIYNVLKELISKGYRNKDKELRNDLLVIAWYIAERERNHKYFLECGFLDLLCVHSFGSELEYLTTGLCPKFVLYVAQADYEMKKLMWQILLLLSFHDDCLLAMLEREFLLVLLSYISNFEFLRATKFPANYIQECQKQSLEILFALSVRSPEEFVHLGGVEIVLNFVENCPDASLLNAGLAVLMNSSTTQIGAEKLASAKTCTLMLDIATDTLLSINARRDALHVIGSICATDSGQVIFRECKGIELTVPILANYIPGLEDLMSSLIDCIWKCIVGDMKNEDSFIEMEGPTYLMNLLEQAPDWLRMILLSCLIDLIVRNPDAADCVREWNSPKTGMTTSQVLVSIWIRQDEDKIEEPEAMKKEREEESAEIKIDFKMKVYCMYLLLGMDNEDMIQPITEPKGKAVLIMVREYNKYLINEVWKGIEQSLEREGVRATTPDLIMMQQKREGM